MRNIINVDMIEDDIDLMLRNQLYSTNEEERKWFKTTGRKWLIKFGPVKHLHAFKLKYDTGTEDVFWCEFENAEDVSRAIRIANKHKNSINLLTHGTVNVYDHDVPTWAETVMEKGLPLHVAIGMEDFTEKSRVIADYFSGIRHLPEYKRINRVSFDDAFKAAEEWHVALSKREIENVDATQGTKIIHEFSDDYEGWKIVELLTKDQHRYEGGKMGHCVGWAGYYEDSSCSIYSLRDPREKPHATIQMRGNNAVQIKGKQNRAVVKKYQPMIREFVQLKNIRVNHDGRNVGLINFGGRYFENVNEFIESTHLDSLADDYEKKPNWGTNRVQDICQILKDHRGDITDANLQRLWDILNPRDHLISYDTVAVLNCHGHEVKVLEPRYPTLLFALTDAGLFTRFADARKQIDDAVNQMLRDAERTDCFIHVGNTEKEYDRWSRRYNRNHMVKQNIFVQCGIEIDGYRIRFHEMKRRALKKARDAARKKMGEYIQTLPPRQQGMINLKRAHEASGSILKDERFKKYVEQEKFFHQAHDYMERQKNAYL